MTNKALSIFNQLRPVTVGFDNVFDHFERMFEDDFTSFSAPTFPFYNIVKQGKNKYDIELALAGYSKDDNMTIIRRMVTTRKQFCVKKISQKQN